MDGPEAGAEPREGEGQSPEQSPEENGGGGMEEEVFEVIAEGVVVPDAIVDPEGGEGEGIPLAGGAFGEPDVVEAVWLGHDGGGGVVVVVPEELTGGGGEEGDEHHQGENAGPEIPVIAGRGIVGEGDDEGGRVGRLSAGGGGGSCAGRGSLRGGHLG